MTIKLIIEKTAGDIKVVNPIEIEIPENKIVVFVGLNSTLKSITARSIGPDQWKPKLSDLGLKYKIEYSKNGIKSKIDYNEWLCKYAMDSRLVLREWLRIFDSFYETIKNLEALKNSIDDERIKEELSQYIAQLIDHHTGLVKIPNDYLDLKRQADTFKLSTLFNILYNEVLNEVIDKIKELGEEINTNNLLPMDVEIFDEPRGEKWIKVWDRRFNREISKQNLSSSIASILLFKYVITLLANVEYERRILIIEEPEEAMAPPQQILLIKYLENILERSKDLNIGENYIIITTHSPYIALSGKKRVVSYYFKIIQNEFHVEKAIPRKPFILGDLLLLP